MQIIQNKIKQITIWRVNEKGETNKRIIKDIIKVLKTKLKSPTRRQNIYKYASFTKKV